ncbi:phospholipid carrier-dependent glycosyltransferase [Candidatus Daviesbacteria bacterium]|nr:phospholipid carrier-dependent glycosyltransferase [Candidatus Daviesbacteria bacterium]
MTHKKILIAILIIAAFLRFFRLDYPNKYVFDEVYHGFTAKQYAKGLADAWVWWTKPPPNVAYEWTHPPLAKEIMTLSILITGSEDAWAWRLPGAMLGVVSVLTIYLISKELFKNERISLASSFIFSLDGLNFVQSRTGMNDIYLVTFVLISLFFFLKKRFIISAIFLGLAISSKWTGVYFLGLYFILFLFKPRQLINLTYFFIIIPTVYLLSYIPFFIMGFDWGQFIELQRQMWYYHTHLKAAHDYASAWWTWPLNLYPVWFFVEYFPKKIANIYASGNPAVFWLGIGALVLTITDFIKKRSLALAIVLGGYFIFWLPWAFSPRIMFLYHYSPSVPFLSLALGYQLGNYSNLRRDKITLLLILILIFVSFTLVYPMLTGIPLPRNLLDLFYKINLNKNPFG